MISAKPANGIPFGNSYGFRCEGTAAVPRASSSRINPETLWQQAELASSVSCHWGVRSCWGQNQTSTCSQEGGVITNPGTAPMCSTTDPKVPLHLPWQSVRLTKRGPSSLCIRQEPPVHDAGVCRPAGFQRWATMCDLFTCGKTLFYWRNTLHLESSALSRECAVQ